MNFPKEFILSELLQSSETDRQGNVKKSETKILIIQDYFDFTNLKQKSVINQDCFDFTNLRPKSFIIQDNFDFTNLRQKRFNHPRLF